MQADHDPTAAMTDEQRSARLEAQAEQAYDKMYDATHSSDAAARYSDAKESMREAIAPARRLGQVAAANRLETRLAPSRLCSARSLVERGHSLPRLAANRRLMGGNRSMARNATRDKTRLTALSVVVCCMARKEFRTALKP